MEDPLCNSAIGSMVSLDYVTRHRMSRERIQIKCPAKPITFAFLQFTDSEVRDKYMRSANVQKNERIRISLAMDAEERFQQKRLGYIKICLNKKHEIPLTKITVNRVKKHVSVKGQKVVRTCESGSLKYHKFQNIEEEVEDYTDDWLSKKSWRRLRAVESWRADAGMRRGLRVVTKEEHSTQTSTKNKPMEKAEADKDSVSLIETVHCAYEAEK